MKHHKPMTRTPAGATSALGSKILFKEDISSFTAMAVPIIVGNLTQSFTGLLQNSLGLGTYVEIIIEEITGNTTG